MAYLLTTDPDFFDLAGWQAHLIMLEKYFPEETSAIGMARRQIVRLEKFFAAPPKKRPWRPVEPPGDPRQNRARAF